MKRIKSLLFLTIVLLAFSPAKAGTPALGAALNNVTRAYLGIKNALVSNSIPATQKSAIELINALNGVPVKEMTAGQHKIWDSYSTKLEFDSRHISESGAIDHQREHFASLSTNLFSVLKAMQMNAATLYKQYCPMKKAYWISETATIKNPYYGTGSMVTCGETKETLKAF